MNDYQLTPRSKWLYKKAKNITEQLGTPFVSIEHLLTAFFFCEESKSIRILSEMGFDYESFRMWLVEDYFSFDDKSKNKKIDCKPSENLLQVFDVAAEFANECDDGYISIDHIFIGVLSSIELVDPPVAKKLYFEIKYFEENIVKYFGQETFVDAPVPKEVVRNQTKTTKASLEKNCINLNEKCNGAEYNISGREEELKRMEYILNRKVKNNVLIVGDSGVGKTALVEFLANRVSSGCGHVLLSDKEIYSLNLNSLVSGTKYRGDFERKMEAIIDDCKDSNIILYIDEIHTLIGAGDAEGGLDAANILKPYLANGEITVIGSTTYEEYRKKIYQDKALTRRFDVINLKAPSAQETLEILLNKKDHFINYHGVFIDDAVLQDIIELSDKYIKETNFPDKAIDLLDLACSHCKVQKTKKPASLQKQEEEVVNTLVKIASQSEDIRQEAMQKVPVLKFKNAYEKWLAKVKSGDIVGDLKIDHVIDALCHKTGIPKDKFTKQNKIKYINLEKEIKKDIFGQDEAVNKIAKCLLRYKSGLRDNQKPIGSFLFLGSTGVGKTHLAKTLANKMFVTQDSFVRFDMSEFSEEQSVSKLIGSSPGYIGYDKGGILIEKVCQNPHSIILFDEIEKSHAKVQKVLLQILEEGELTDSIGRKASFNNCVIIVTGNIGSRQLSTKTTLGFKPEVSSDESKQEAFKALKQYMPLELINRFDEIIFFNDFTEDNMKKIIKKELSKFASINSTKIKYSSSLINFIYKKNKNKEFGARQLKRIIQNEVLDLLSSFLLENENQIAINITFSSKLNKVVIK